MMLKLTTTYACFLAFLFIFLSVRTIRERRRSKVAIGSSTDPALERAVRAHANFSEYVPFALFLMAISEIHGSNPVVLHGAGLMLSFSRISHAFGISRLDEDFRFRVGGMIGTFTTYFILMASNLFLILR